MAEKVRYSSGMCQVKVACDGADLQPSQKMCASCRELTERRERVAKEQAKIDALMWQALKPCKDDRKHFGWEVPQTHRNKRRWARKPEGTT